MIEPREHNRKAFTPASAPLWLTSMRRYLWLLAALNLAWEVLHLPLCTLWQQGTPSQQISYILHCTFGDLLVGLSALTIALLLAGKNTWPRNGFTCIMVITTSIGVVYTIYSERLNTIVRESWAYSDLMPIIPGLDVGLSPILQWLVIPPFALWWVHRLLTTNARQDRI